MWNLIIPAVASLAGGLLAGEGSRKAGNAEADAANNATKLQRDIYQDQRGLARPSYLTGGAATNGLAAQFGIKPQNYEAAFGGEGGTNGLNNPYGQSDQWSAYLNANQDVYDYWKSNEKLRKLYPNANDFAAYHYANFGQSEGRQIPTAPGAAPASSSPDSEAANGLSDPMAGFMSSPYGKIATSGFRGVDVPEVNSAFGSRGKALSGAQSIALDERGKARLGGAYTDYTNGLRSLAGMNQTASAQVGSAAGQYGANAGNLMVQAGQAKGDALKSGYNGLMQGVSGALGGVMDFGKRQWGWA
jgi:hypothetical protein